MFAMLVLGLCMAAVPFERNLYLVVFGMDANYY
jgi:hypothetical protein